MMFLLSSIKLRNSSFVLLIIFAFHPYWSHQWQKYYRKGEKIKELTIERDIGSPHYAYFKTINPATSVAGKEILSVSV